MYLATLALKRGDITNRQIWESRGLIIHHESPPVQISIRSKFCWSSSWALHARQQDPISYQRGSPQSLQMGSHHIYHSELRRLDCYLGHTAVMWYVIHNIRSPWWPRGEGHHVTSMSTRGHVTSGESSTVLMTSPWVSGWDKHILVGLQRCQVWVVFRYTWGARRGWSLGIQGCQM